MNKVAVGFGYDIINILKQEKYKISKSRINYMQTVLEKSVVFDVKYIVNEKVPLLDIHQNCYGSIEVLNIPQVIDVPPVCLNNRVVEMSPIMILDIYKIKENTWSVLHEICHLLTIGKYTYGDDCIYHKFGINEYEYNKTNMLLIKRDENSRMNELINDYVVWRLMETLYGHKVEPIYIGIKKFSKYLENRCKENFDENCFIGWYFSGNIPKIKKILFDINYKSYDDILEYLIKN